MAIDAPPVTTEPQTPVIYTTRRGIATAAFCLGLWGSLTFWWYPFGMWVGLFGLLLGTIANVFNWRANSQLDNLATVGQVLGGMAATTAYVCYRVMQMYFEGYAPYWP